MGRGDFNELLSGGVGLSVSDAIAAAVLEEILCLDDLIAVHLSESPIYSVYIHIYI